MNLLVDEGVDMQIVNRLRHEGHFVAYVAEMDPGVSDEVVLELANRQKMLLVTADKDFGELVFRQRRLSSGVVLIRLSGVAPAKKAEIISNLINEHAEELKEAFSVITRTGTRIRTKTA